MVRSAGILILVMLGSIIGGILCGFLLYYIFHLIQNKRQSLSQKNVSNITTGTAKKPVASMMKVGINKTYVREINTSEILFKYPPNTVILERGIKSLIPNSPLKPAIVNQKNTLMVEEPKQYSEPNVLNLLEIIHQKNITVPEELKESPKSDDHRLLHYTNTAESEIQKKTNPKSVVIKPNIAQPKKKSTGRETKKSSKPNAADDLKIIKQEKILVLSKLRQSFTPGVLTEPEVFNQQIKPGEVKQNESPKSEIIQELETNLAIATTPWSNKILPFQTSSWDSKHAEEEPLLISHIQDLLQLYVDMGLANDINWLATEINHRTKELDESYIRLCNSITERIKNIMSL
jgi:hypothetical protein